MLTARSATSTAPARIGRPHQKSRPTNTATSSGASAVPTPRSAFSTSTDESTFVGLNAAVKVLSDGTVKPNPTPRLAVAASNSGYATASVCCTVALTTSKTIATMLAMSPIR